MKRLKSVLFLGLVFFAAAAEAANLDTVADRVLGQTNFAGATSGTSETKIGTAYGLGVDRRTGRIYVADSTNNRVISWLNAASFTNGQAADKVFGQPSFTANTANNGGISASSLSGPRGVAVDDNSNLYVADTGNNRILVYRDPNTLDTVADFVIGQTNFASNGASTTSSTLSGPRGIAIDSSNNLYVADTNNNRVLEFDTPLGTDGFANRVFGQLGSFTTSFTNNIAGANGTPTAFNLNGPYGVGVDSQGNVYIADTFNNRVLVYTTPLTTDVQADYVIGQTVFTASSTGITSTTLNGPYRLVVDSADNLYVCDSNNNRVLEYNSPNNSSGKAANRVFGQPNFTSNTSNNGGISASSLSLPYDVAVDSANNVYIMDTGNFRVLGFDLPAPNTAPTQTTLFPSVIAEGSSAFSLRVDGAGFVQSSVVRVNGNSRNTTFINPTRLAADLTAADVAVSGTATITVFTPTPGGGTSALQNLTIYTRGDLDTTADRIIGQPDFETNAANTGGVTARSLQFVVDMAVDPSSGRFWVADSGNNRVLSWSSAAAITNGQPADIVLGQPDFSSSRSNFGGVAGAATANNLNSPSGVVIDGNGNLFVSDSGNNRVLLYLAPIVSGQAASKVFGQPDFVSRMVNGGGAPAANTLHTPFGLALDSKGNLYVSDYQNNRVLVYLTPLTSDTTADFVFGQGGVFSTATANKGTLATNGASCLNGPVSVALDASDNVYISDFGNSRVLIYTTPLTTDTAADKVIGQNNDFTSAVSNLGGVSASSLGGPYGVAVTRAGDLYVADYSNFRVLEYDTPLTTDLVADRVFGQGGSFVNSFFNNGGVSNNSLSLPRAASLDGNGNLYISDNFNNRILMYDKPSNKAPVVVSGISATPSSQFVGQSVLFGYSASDADGDTLTYTWDFGDGSAGTGTAPSHIYSAAGTFNAKVTVSDGFGGTATATTPITVTAPDAPVFTSLAVASGPVGEPLSFPITAAGTAPITISTAALPAGLSFDGATLSGTPTASGTTPVTVTAVSFAGTTTQTLTIIITGDGVSSSTVDSDGDGFSDEVEAAAGFDPKNPTATPFGGNPAGTPEALFVSKLQIGLNYAKPGNDTLQLAGVLTVPTGFVVSGSKVIVDVGGVVKSFSLDSKGSSPKANDTIKVSIKASKGVVAAQSPKFAVKYSKGTWQGLFADEGLTNTTASNAPKTVPVVILFNNKVFKADVAQLYTAKQNSSGKTKLPSTGAGLTGR